jgi:hypothetical protein
MRNLDFSLLRIADAKPLSYQPPSHGAGQHGFGQQGGGHGFGQHGLGAHGLGQGSQHGSLSQQQLVRATAVTIIATVVEINPISFFIVNTPIF